MTCIVSGLSTTGNIVWKNQDGTQITSDGTQFVINTENTLAGDEQKSELTKKTAKLSTMTDGEISTYLCEFTSGEVATSPKESRSFTVEKLAFSE